MYKDFSVIKHPFHLVDPSPWPVSGSYSVLGVVVGIAGFMHSFVMGIKSLVGGALGTFATMAGWWRDVVREGTADGSHTKPVQSGLSDGMILFIVSEFMFFVSFFWGFFHACLAPTIEIGYSWPPVGIVVLSPWGIPLLNTLILLLSGFTVTVSHYSIIFGKKGFAMLYLFMTLSLAEIFLILQVFEYTYAPFFISDSVYGSIFFLTTGFHGFHVLIGLIFLTVCFVRLRANHFSQTHHLGLEFAIYYWHFVDVVWLFLFVCVYWLCGSIELA